MSRQVIIVFFICILSTACCAQSNFWSTLSRLVKEKFSSYLNKSVGLIFRTVCYDDIGCFYNGPPWYDAQERPISLVPEDASRVRFPLFTRKQRTIGYDLKPNRQSLKDSPFNDTLKTFIVTPPYTTNPTIFAAGIALKDKILEEENYNVIVPEIGNYLFGRYEKAVANARTVGARIAYLVNFLINNTNAQAESFHLAGPSLGAQVAGYAGKRIKNLGKITAIDPAGPFFHNVPEEVRLTKDDAKFVQVIHADDGHDLLTGYGMYETIGDIDFYVNGGKFQPMCSITSKNPFIGTAINETSKIAFGLCDHLIVNVYYYESVNNTNCKFLGVSCDSNEDFEAGKCRPENSIVGEMGFHAEKMDNVQPGTKFFLKTNTFPPFRKKTNLKRHRISQTL